MKKISIFYFSFLLLKNKFSNFKTIDQLFQKYGDNIVIKFLKKKYFLTKDLHISLKILSSHETQWSKNSFTDELKDLLGNGILISRGQFWQSHRKIIQPFFSQKNLMLLITKILDETENILTELETKISNQKQQITLNSFFRNIIAHTTAKILFGLPSKKTNEFITDVLDKYLSYNSGGLLFTPLKRLFYRSRIKIKITQLDKIIDKTIEKNKNSETKQENFIQHLLTASNHTTSPLDNVELRDEVKTMLFASYETMGETLCWVFYHLAHDKNLQNAIIQDSTLELATSVFKETLRLFPPLWCLGREAISKTKISHIEFQKGDNVIIPIVFLQRDQKYWAEPTRFNPYRFLNKHDENKSDNFLAWIPFGHGSRGCIGKQFALMEAPALIYSFLKKFTINPILGQKVSQTYSLSMRSKYPLKIQIEKRMAFI